MAQRIDKAVFPFMQGGPLMHAVAAKAVALQGGGSAGVSRSTPARWSPTRRRWPTGWPPRGMRPVSGGTDTHLALIDLQELGVTGREAEARCDAARITLNKNAIPYDPANADDRLRHPGRHPGVTTQGMGESDMKEVASLIGRAVRSDPGTDAGRAVLAEVSSTVEALVARYPAYPRPERPAAVGG